MTFHGLPVVSQRILLEDKVTESSSIVLWLSESVESESLLSCGTSCGRERKKVKKMRIQRSMDVGSWDFLFVTERRNDSLSRMTVYTNTNTTPDDGPVATMSV